MIKQWPRICIWKLLRQGKDSLRESTLETKHWLCPIPFTLPPFTPLEQKPPYLLTSGLRIFFLLLSCRCDKLIKQGLSIFHLFNCLESRVFSMLGCKFTKSSSVTKWQVCWFGRPVFARTDVQQKIPSLLLEYMPKYNKRKSLSSLRGCLINELQTQWKGLLETYAI